MKLKSFRPAFRLLFVLSVAFSFSVCQLFFPELKWLMLSACGMLTVIFLFDFMSLWSQPLIELERIVSNTLPLGVASKVKLTLRNRSDKRFDFELIDHYPTEHEVKDFPFKVKLDPGQFIELDYTITPQQRGDFEFAQCELRLNSLLSFWHRYFKVGKSSEVRVYPNYAEVIRYGVLAAEQRLAQLGIMKKRQRGSGTDFLQLREFRRGDRLGSIDWKATARMQKVISRQYQAEQDQQIFFMVDCGRRMRSMDGHLSHFDHTLNAMLLLTYVASRQGDAVGMMTYGTKEQRRFLPVKKSVNNVNRFLTGLYDLHPSTLEGDSAEAVQELKKVLKKRAMIIVLTNMRDQQDPEMLESLKVLRKSHLVVFVALKEEVFAEQEQLEIESFKDALKYSSLNQFLRGRKKALESMQGNQVITLDVAPSQLHASLVNCYLDIKNSAAL
ncbi:DUF58 domain-containing protein [Lentisphaera profundi]|uniref:DUF58 domain-containing protein n=1 Tax=Lentisphaera profundi TaxID=1658616 RepID=A0ABY7VVQ4_9BACT|nr:DUF58 domain-containing protein [Lentisphaera profundi]WDE98316.1 DUF58 domain-containing protein [Lentisphaera profundi]